MARASCTVTVRVSDAEEVGAIVAFVRGLAAYDPSMVEEVDRLAQNWHLEAGELIEDLAKVT